MADLRLRDEIDCDEDTFWDKCIFDQDFNKRLFEGQLKFNRVTVLEQKDEGATIRKKQEAEPPLGNLPGPLKKVIGDKLSYLEEGVFDKAKKTYSFKVTPSTLPEKTKASGTMRTEKLDGKRCVRIVDVHVEVKVFAVGGMIEDKIVADMRHSYETAVGFIGEYVKEKGY